MTFMFHIATTKRWTKIYRTLILCEHFVYTENGSQSVFFIKTCLLTNAGDRLRYAPMVAQWLQSILINATPGGHKFPVHFAD